jgi:hypothetical protein
MSRGRAATRDKVLGTVSDDSTVQEYVFTVHAAVWHNYPMADASLQVGQIMLTINEPSRARHASAILPWLHALAIITPHPGRIPKIPFGYIK